MLHRPSLLERDKLAAGHPGPRAVPWGPRRRQRPLPTSGASGRPLLGDLRAPVLAPAPGVLRDAVAASALTSGHPAVSISVAGRLSPRLHGPGAGPGAGRGRAEPGGPDGLRTGDPCEGNLRTRVPDTSTASAIGARAHCQRGAQGVLGCVHGAGGRGAGARERRPVCFPGLCPLLSRQPARRHRPPPAPASPPARRPPPVSSRPQPARTSGSACQRAAAIMPGDPDPPAAVVAAPPSHSDTWSDAESPAGHTEQSSASQGRSPDHASPQCETCRFRAPSQADQVRHSGCVSHHGLPARPDLGGPRT